MSISSTVKLCAISCSLTLCVLASVGCTTYYYKRFVFGGQPHYPDIGFVRDDLMFVVSVDAGPFDKLSFSDSSYAVRVLVTSADECNEVIRVIVQSTFLDSLMYRTRGPFNALIPDTLKRGDYCTAKWSYPSIVIPDSIESIEVGLLLHYNLDGKRKDLDTALVMYRSEGKEKELVHF